MKSFLKKIRDLLLMFEGFLIAKYNSLFNKNFRCTKDTKRCFYNRKSPSFRYEYFGKNTPVCCATNLYNILKDVIKILEQNNIKYFVSFGTLLGAVRHGGMIPWDTDIDLIVAQNDIKEVADILKRNSLYDIKIVKESNVVGEIIKVNLSQINTLHIDLFSYEKKGSKIIFGYNREFDIKDIYPLKNIDFYNLKLLAPNNINKQLETFYGKEYMKYGYKQWAFSKTKFKITDYSPAKVNI